MNEIVPLDTNINQIIENAQSFNKQQYSEFFQYFNSRHAKVIVIDELGVSVELTLRNIEIECSYYDEACITLDCYGPINIKCPEGVELR